MSSVVKEASEAAAGVTAHAKERGKDDSRLVERYGL